MPAVINHFLSVPTALDVQIASWSAPVGIAARQQVRLSSLLYTLANGPTLYAAYLRDCAGSSAPLQALPVIGKDELMDRFDQWVADPQLRLPELKALTADPQRIAEPYLGRYQVWASSGSSGVPGIFVQDAFTMAVYDALESLRRSPVSALRRAVDPLYLQERVAFVGATGGHFASMVQMRRLQQIYPWMAQTTCSISIMQPMQALVEAINVFQPTIIATYPSVALALADQKDGKTLHAAPREIWTGGETLSASARARVARAFQCPVRNHYGASEFLSIAGECSHGQLHANTDWLVLEPVDEKFKPVPPGHASATTLLTNLANRIQPIVRYDLGDQITVSTRPCGCGSALPAIQVAGRNDPPLKMRDHNAKPVVLLPLALTTVLEEQAGLYAFQLCQRDDQTLELQIPQSGAQADAALLRAGAALQEFVRLQGLPAVRILTRPGVAMRLGRSGKTCRTVAASDGHLPGT